jgi:hypothetical protein
MIIEGYSTCWRAAKSTGNVRHIGNYRLNPIAFAFDLRHQDRHPVNYVRKLSYHEVFINELVAVKFVLEVNRCQIFQSIGDNDNTYIDIAADVHNGSGSHTGQ